MADMNPLVLSSSTLAGDSVVNRDEDKLGHLKDLMIDVNHGRIAYGVLARGGVAGLGEKLFAVPWALFDVDTEGHRLVLDLSEEVLDNSPGFDKDNWPTFSERDWAAELHDHYGLSPYWE